MHSDPVINGPQVRIVQNFGVVPTQVFAAWLDPDAIGHWMH